MSGDAGQDPGSQGGGSEGQDPKTGAGAEGKEGAAGKTPTKGQDPKTGQDPKQQLDAEATAQELKRARREAAAERAERKKTKSKLDKVLKALGAEDEDDPEKLPEIVQQLRSENKALKGRKQFDAAAKAANADADLTHAVLQSQGKLADVDYDDSEALADLIKAAVKANPKLSAGEKKTVGAGAGEAGETGSGDVNDWIRREAGRK